MSRHDSTFRAMGSEIRLILEDGVASQRELNELAAGARRFIEDYEQRLSRFRPDSELCALNADSRREVPASQLLRDAVAAGIRVAELTDGLVDPTLVGEIEAAGYVASREGASPASLADALLLAPARRPAAPSPEMRWRRFEIDEADSLIRRPPGMKIDSGGFGKGLAADLLAERLGEIERFVVGCGGDLRIGGREPAPFDVLVEHPVTGRRDRRISVARGGVATSGVNVRIWRRADGSYAHHLLDPATGAPAWTGLVGATALAPTALEAEALSKAALLSGPAGAEDVLSEHGGLVVHEDGDVEAIGPIELRPYERVVIPLSSLRPGVAA
jgi:thiamine biosynthesis lipoprotein